MEEDLTTAEGTATPDTETNQENVGDEGVVDHGEVVGEGGDEVGGEHIEGEHMEGEHVEGEHIDGEHAEATEHVLGEGEELKGEEMEGEGVEGEEQGEKEQPKVEEEYVEEEEVYVEPPPPDPTAPFDFSDSKEALKEPFALRQDQVAEAEQLWELYQNYTPAYTDIDNYITEKELFYMLKALILYPVTDEQFHELIAYCVRPPHPDNHINFEQFLKIVTLRVRELSIEDELKTALQVFDPERTGSMDRENLKDVLLKQGHKMSQKQLDNLIKEVDMSNDGTIGIDDVVGTMCIDLNKEDLIMLYNSIFPPDLPPPQDDDM